MSQQPDEKPVVSREALGELVNDFVERRLRGERASISALLRRRRTGDLAVDEIFDVLLALDDLASFEDETECPADE